MGNLISIMNGYMSGFTQSLQDRSWQMWALWLIQEANAQMNLNKAAVSPPTLSTRRPLKPGQQLHLSSLTYRNLTQLETFNRYLNDLQDDFSQ